jgi:hypothetical protein
MINCQIYQENCKHRCTYVFNLLYKEAPEDVSCKPKHAALCDVTLKCCAVQHIFICL